MQLFPVGKVYDFMGQKRLFVTLSTLLVLASLTALFIPGPLLGTDFQGGTEIEVAFKKPVSSARLRSVISGAGFTAPMVVKVDDAANPHRYLIRVQEVSTIDEPSQRKIEAALCFGDKLPADRCPESRQATEVKFSPGGDKITVRYGQSPDLQWVRQRMEGMKSLGVVLREGDNNPLLQNPRAHKVEIQLKSKGDQLLDALKSKLGHKVVPAEPLRVEWIGPKAGAQLRDAALKSIGIALVFIMAYIAFRFDLRFAPGAVIALAHDSIVTVGVLILLQRLTNRMELNLSTVAAVLTIVGYSVNDTVVVYDRVRENLGRLRGASFPNLVNASLSEMLSRTVLTSGTTVTALIVFFIWGTGTLEEFVLTIIIGLVLGTYSSIYVALPLTEWLDRKFFAGLRKPRRAKA